MIKITIFLIEITVVELLTKRPSSCQPAWRKLIAKPGSVTSRDQHPAQTLIQLPSSTLRSSSPVGSPMFRGHTNLMQAIPAPNRISVLIPNTHGRCIESSPNPPQKTSILSFHKHIDI